MNNKYGFILKILVTTTIILTIIFFVKTGKTLSIALNRNTLITEPLTKELTELFYPNVYLSYWGEDNTFIKWITNLFYPTNKLIYEASSIEAGTIPSQYLIYYDSLKKSDEIGEATVVASDNMIQNEEKINNNVNKYTMSQLRNYEYLVNEFYTVDRTTYIDDELINIESLLENDLRINKEKDTILIYHTHSQEAFIDSTEGDLSTGIVGVGSYLAKILSEQYGFNVIHNTQVYDYVDGKLDRNKAYTYAEKDLEKILAENPQIEVIIDLHRDGISGDKMTTTINEKETARLMFFNGLSRTVETGEIDALYNPNLSGNLSMSLQAQIIANNKYPGLMRHIYLKGYQYNLHLKPKSLLIEAGSQKNTLQEMLNAMEPLADILNDVLTKEITIVE